MIKYLALISTRMLNFFPVKGGILKYYSPNMIMNKSRLDYDKHCKVQFGAYVQAYRETQPKNSQDARTIDAVYLRPTDNQQGGHEVLNLNTGRVITTLTVTEIPVTEVVIKAVETMAYKEGFKTLKVRI